MAELMDPAEARRILMACDRHSDADCDHAAQRLARSSRHEDQTLAAEWQKARNLDQNRRNDHA